jgi:hypothetical protein
MAWERDGEQASDDGRGEGVLMDPHSAVSDKVFLIIICYIFYSFYRLEKSVEKRKKGTELR